MILLVEDDHALGAQVVKTLEDADYAVRWIQDGDAARHVELDEVELIILDLMLPGTYGLDLLKLYRTRTDAPALILSARSNTSDKVRSLQLGADDYLTKPFWPEELVARVQARLRRPAFERERGALEAGPIALDEEARSLRVDGRQVDVTSAEFEILRVLLRRLDSAVPRATLLEAALDPNKEGNVRTLDVHISRLRKKLGPASGQLTTVWGIGYRLLSTLPEPEQT